MARVKQTARKSPTGTDGLINAKLKAIRQEKAVEMAKERIDQQRMRKRAEDKTKVKRRVRRGTVALRYILG